MTIEAMAEDKIRVALSWRDMDSIGIKYEDLDYRNEQTRLMLDEILETAKEETGFDSTGAKLFVEVFQDAEGGCVFLFTRMKKDSGVKSVSKLRGGRKGLVKIIVRFDTVESLCLYCSVLLKNKRLLPLASSLYTLDGGYYLLLDAFACNYGNFRLFSSEYAQEIRRGTVASSYIEEFGKSVSNGKALEKMAALHFSAY
ncbi:MAG: adaptor protein MecA [Oscillospiraceae bacterium]|jgi:adapter protein MecA 1/2|nr:adaptor protein MecA [Oscillospiraceae bacterium]